MSKTKPYQVILIEMLILTIIFPRLPMLSEKLLNMPKQKE